MSIFKVTDPDDYVFRNKSSVKITPKGIEYILKKYVDECKNKNQKKIHGKVFQSFNETYKSDAFIRKWCKSNLY